MFILQFAFAKYKKRCNSKSPSNFHIASCIRCFHIKSFTLFILYIYIFLYIIAFIFIASCFHIFSNCFYIASYHRYELLLMIGCYILLICFCCKLLSYCKLPWVLAFSQTSSIFTLTKSLIVDSYSSREIMTLPRPAYERQQIGLHFALEK